MYEPSNRDRKIDRRRSPRQAVVARGGAARQTLLRDIEAKRYARAVKAAAAAGLRLGPVIDGAMVVTRA